LPTFNANTLISNILRTELTVSSNLSEHDIPAIKIMRSQGPYHKKAC